MVSIIESVGDYHAIATVTGAEITEKHIGRGGIGAEGLACSIAGFLAPAEQRAIPKTSV